jgi:hypothetical protein
MIVVLAGLSFEVFPDGRLSPAERRALQALPTGTAGAGGGRAFVVELATDPPVLPGEGDSDEDVVSTSDHASAVVRWSRDRVRIGHRRLRATLDPFAGRGTLARDASVGWPLEVTLRVALAARLPLEGGVALHAAGIVVGEGGLVFFGPSGAGKSTLAASSPGPVLSDEMVAVTRPGDAYALAGTGFWGTLGASPAPSASFPLRALVELDKAPALRMERLDPRTAVRRLIPSALVPPGPPLWSEALAVLGRMAREVPVVRMGWSPAEPPWEALADLNA